MLEQLKEDVLEMIDSGANKTIRETRGLKNLTEKEGVVTVEIYLENPKADYASEFKNALVRLVKLNYGYKGIKVTLKA